MPSGALFHCSALFRWAVVLTLCVAIGLIIVQGKRIVALEDSLAASLAGELPEGTLFGPLQVHDLSGKTHLLDFRKPNAKPTIVYIFRPTCIWCQRNEANLRHLTVASAGKYDMVGLSLSSAGLSDFIRREGIGFPVYQDILPSAIANYRLGRTPETIVVSAEAKIIQTWNGAYMQEPIRSSLERFFLITLPNRSNY